MHRPIPQNSNSITNNKSIIESVYVINDSTGANNGTYSCKAIYTMNGEDFPGKLLSTEVFVEGEKDMTSNKVSNVCRVLFLYSNGQYFFKMIKLKMSSS